MDRHSDRHYTDLLIELKCPICTNYMCPPIHQCATGHSVCENCRRKLERCALCQRAFTESRNIALEGLEVKMRYPCINKDSGCNIKFAYNERENHEARCTFKSYKCALERCPWVGRVEDIPQHWASKKMTSKPYQSSNVCQTKIRLDSYYVNMVEAYNKLFWFKYKMNKKMLYWSVQYIGPSGEAENYWYEIDVFKSNHPKHRILLSNYCHPVDMDNLVLFEKACISIPVDVVKPFLGTDQSLKYIMRVNVAKENQPEERPNCVPSQQHTDEEIY